MRASSSWQPESNWRNAPNPYRGMQAQQIHTKLRDALLPKFPWLSQSATARISARERSADFLRLFWLSGCCSFRPLNSRPAAACLPESLPSGFRAGTPSVASGRACTGHVLDLQVAVGASWRSRADPVWRADAVHEEQGFTFSITAVLSLGLSQAREATGGGLFVRSLWGRIRRSRSPRRRSSCGFAGWNGETPTTTIRQSILVNCGK